MRCCLGYLHRQEPQGANHTLSEATIQLKYKLIKYNVQDAQEAENQGPEPQELQADKAAIDYKPTDRDVANLEGIIAEAKLTNKEDREALENSNTAETNHLQYMYIPQLECYTNNCLYYYNAKHWNNRFPKGQVLVYYNRTAIKEILEQRQSTRQLQLKNQESLTVSY